MQGVAEPLNALNEDRRRADIEDRLQRAADIDRQQEHQVHHQQEDRHAQPAVEDHFIQHIGQAVGHRLLRVADRVAQGGDGLVARVGDHQRRVFLLLLLQRLNGRRQQRDGGAGQPVAVDVALQHLQCQPAALHRRQRLRHGVAQRGDRFQQ